MVICAMRIFKVECFDLEVKTYSESIFSIFDIKNTLTSELVRIVIKYSMC